MSKGTANRDGMRGYEKVLVSFREDAGQSMLQEHAKTFVSYVALLPPLHGTRVQSFKSFVGQAMALRAPPTTESRIKVFPHLGLAIAVVNRQGMIALSRDPSIKSVNKAPEVSLLRPVASKLSAPPPHAAWGIDKLRVTELWDKGIRGDGVIVGHLDTGVDASHECLRNKVVKFAEWNLNGDRVAKAKPYDSDTHGTHTAGTIVGGSKKSAIGVAPGAKLASALVLDGGEVLDRILGGLEWMAGLKVAIVNASLGIPGYTPAFHVLIDALRRNGILPVIAIGNDGSGTNRSPGNYSNVLSVGAMNSSNQVADFSGDGRCRPDGDLLPDLVAPGVDIVSAAPRGRFATGSGTSMAAPHVAGVAALLKQAKPSASAIDIEKAILMSCVRPASMPQGRANRGVPDAIRALSYL